jgi:DNA repair exonuclease SbcCD ATPase subunit
VRLQFHSLVVENFKSITGRVAVPFLRLGTGLHFVRGENLIEPRLGSNGAGKSTLWDALCWCMYGKTPDGERSTDIVSWHTEQGARVRLRYSADKEEHALTRHTHPNRLSLDGQPCSAKDAELGLSFDTFVNTILLGQGRPLFFDLTPSGKLQLFTDALDLNRWEARAAGAGKRAQELQREADQLYGEINTLQAQEQTLQTNIDSLQEQQKEWQQRWQARKAVRAADVQTLRKAHATLAKQHEEATLIYDKAMTELKPLLREIMQLQTYREEAYRRQMKAEAQDAANTREIQRLQADLRLASTGSCPLCGQPVGQRLGHHCAELQVRIDKLQGPTDAGAAKLLADVDSQLKTLRGTEQQLQNNAEKTNATLMAVGPRLAESKTKMMLLVDQEKDGEEERNPYTQQLWKLRQSQEALKTELEQKTGLWRGRSRKLERVAFWQKGFKDLQLYILEEVLAELQLCSNAMLESLGMIGWSVHYDVERETKSGTIQRGLNVLITSPHNAQPVRWESWSGGEGQRLRLLGALALSEVLLTRAGVEPNIEILDEPTAFLSTPGVRDLTELLAERARTIGRGIYYVDHVSRQSAQFSSVLTVVRTPEGTSLREA